MKQPLPQYYTPEEVAASLGVTRRSVYEWLLTGVLKGGRAGRRWVITPAQVEAFVNQRDTPRSPTVTDQGLIPAAPSQSPRSQPQAKKRRR